MAVQKQVFNFNVLLLDTLLLDILTSQHVNSTLMASFSISSLPTFSLTFLLKSSFKDFIWRFVIGTIRCMYTVQLFCNRAQNNF